eukprot:4505194-Amphidinium_carterae.1
MNALVFCELSGHDGDSITSTDHLQYKLLDIAGLDHQTLRSIVDSDCRPELAFQKVTRRKWERSIIGHWTVSDFLLGDNRTCVSCHSSYVDRLNIVEKRYLVVSEGLFFGAVIRYFSNAKQLRDGRQKP